MPYAVVKIIPPISEIHLREGFFLERNRVFVNSESEAFETISLIVEYMSLIK